MANHPDRDGGWRVLYVLSVAAASVLWLAACRSTVGSGGAAAPTPTLVSSLVQTVDVSTPTSSLEQAANADVVHVRAVQALSGDWTFHVTVQHPDIGWEDYADGWDVLSLDGTVLGPDPDSPFTRLLLHPHVDEQPFTRSQSGIVIPDGVTQVRVRAHDLVDGYGGRQVVVDLMVDAGEGFEVERRP